MRRMVASQLTFSYLGGRSSAEELTAQVHKDLVRGVTKGVAEGRGIAEVEYRTSRRASEHGELPSVLRRRKGQRELGGDR